MVFRIVLSRILPRAILLNPKQDRSFKAKKISTGKTNTGDMASAAIIPISRSVRSQNVIGTTSGAAYPVAPKAGSMRYPCGSALAGAASATDSAMM